MTLREQKEVFARLISFRSKMGAKLSSSLLKPYWGKEVIRLIEQDDLLSDSHFNKIAFERILRTKGDVSDFLIGNLVKFVAITGSTAAGVPMEADDIDIFIIVKNDCAWIYRILLKIRLGRKSIWYRTEESKERYCLNYIVEERAISFENEDIFTFNEIVSMVPIFNDSYIDNILSRNEWLHKKYGMRKVLLEDYPLRGNFLVSAMNLIAFILQLMYMILLGHKPDLERLIGNFKQGRIEFFPKDYREKILEKDKDVTDKS